MHLSILEILNEWNYIWPFVIGFFLFFLRIVYLRKRARVSASGGRSRERKRERQSQADFLLSTEPHVGLSYPGVQ